MLIESPQKEVVTSTGKRIDLLLESQEWVIVLENKVFHQQGKTFKDFESFIGDKLHQDRFEGKKAIKPYQQSLLQELPSTLGCNLQTIHTWHGFPAIRFPYESWAKESDVVLFLDGRANNSLCINYYSADLNTTARGLSLISTSERIILASHGMK